MLIIELEITWNICNRNTSEDFWAVGRKSTLHTIEQVPKEGIENMQKYILH